MSESEKHPQDIYGRTKAFALRIIKLYSALPKTAEVRILGKQALRSGTSVGAHLREGRRSRSNAEWISKIEGALQELDETAYWLELLPSFEGQKVEPTGALHSSFIIHNSSFRGT